MRWRSKTKKILIHLRIVILAVLMSIFSVAIYAENMSAYPTPATNVNLWNVIRAHFQLPTGLNQPRVQYEIRWYTSHPGTMYQLLHNAQLFLYYVYQQTQKRSMPAEFALLPMIESSYDPHAYSYAGAGGTWQLMPGTASSFGTKNDWWYAGRRDIITSTNAALDFMVELHNSLNDWELAAAAYNAGQGTVQGAMQANQRDRLPTDFWHLSLPEQTEYYVPKLLALADIIRDPQKYGVHLPFIPDAPYFSEITITSQMDLSEISKNSGASIATIQQLNPGMRRWATSPDGDYRLLLPVADAALFYQNLSNKVGQDHVSWQYHEVHPGETLTSIAGNYHTTADFLQHVNFLDTQQVQPREGLLVPIYVNKTYTLPKWNYSAATVKSIQPAILTRPSLEQNMVQNFETQRALREEVQLIDKLSHKTQPQPTTSTLARFVASPIKAIADHPIEQGDSLKTILQKIYKE